MVKNPVLVVFAAVVLAACAEVGDIMNQYADQPVPITGGGATSGGATSGGATGQVVAGNEIVAGSDSNTGAGEAVPESGEAAGADNDNPALEEDALASAFALTGRDGVAADELDAAVEDGAGPRYAPKAPDGFRIALLLPTGVTGDAGAVSRDIRGGAELAMFSLAGLRPEIDIDMVLVDSAKSVDEVARNLEAAAADIILGPLFSDTTIALNTRLAASDIPIISFSNDTKAVAADESGDQNRSVYILGQTPEAEIRAALAHAIDIFRKAPGQPMPRVAIIGSTADYGMRVADAAGGLLDENGIDPVARLTLDTETLGDQSALDAEIATFAGSLGGYDIIVLAGDISFSLRVAPVLAWHDLDARQTAFVGTALWASAAILQEPSLRGGIFAQSPRGLNAEFAALAQDAGIASPGRYGALGFDAVALAITLAGNLSAGDSSGFTRPSGFAGFSGVFRLLPEGDNARLLDVHEISNGDFRLIQPAATAF